jgi:hypothetical protein
MHRSIFSRGLSATFRSVNRVVPWHRLPRYLGVLNLLAFRDELREKNLHDTERAPSKPSTEPPIVCGEEAHRYRTVAGTCDDLSHPQMGSCEARFGRNMPLSETWPEKEPALLEPSPRVISRRLMTRDEFIPATTLNLLAAAWIQFMTHDWFNHGPNPEDRPIEIALDGPNDPWPQKPRMRIRRTRPDPTRDTTHPDHAKYPPTYRNTISHWWDASSIYGCDDATCKKVRSFQGGKLKVDERSRLPVDAKTGREISGFTDNWWVGLALLHTLFTLEHNAICRRLAADYPNWNDEQLYQIARLINSALMAKIHTVEWTPGILGHPALQVGMAANWWGLLGRRFKNRFGRLGKSDLFSGIPGSSTAHHGAPYSLTEEFTSVYRLHPLIPDELMISSMRAGSTPRTIPITDTLFEKADDVINDTTSVIDMLYSFGTSHPGAITLHNFPRFMQDLKVPAIDGERTEDRVDLAAVDIMRDRERGVPRYNRFRRLIHKPPARDFSDITSNKKWQQELREVYGDVERVDLLVGMLAEDLPKGFGFSDTAFRIFILMATRRLKSDRFFTSDFTAKTYTKAGLDWIENTSIGTVVLRHYPELGPALAGVKNGFAPWNTVTADSPRLASVRS